LANIPKLCLVQDAHAYIEHPHIHAGYNQTSGGFGTVRAIVNAQLTLITQANISRQNLVGQEAKSFLAQVYIVETAWNISFTINHLYVLNVHQYLQ
jgi:hypothetical protein